jgi:hypothetical protein
MRELKHDFASAAGVLTVILKLKVKIPPTGPLLFLWPRFKPTNTLRRLAKVAWHIESIHPPCRVYSSHIESSILHLRFPIFLFDPALRLLRFPAHPRCLHLFVVAIYPKSCIEANATHRGLQPTFSAGRIASSCTLLQRNLLLISPAIPQPPLSAPERVPQ